MTQSNLFICFYADGPYWQDLLYVPAYPPGFTYAKWAFRYDQSKWVAPALEAEATAQQQKKVKMAGILGARFINSRQELLLPLRRIEVTWIDLTGGITQFYFRVQALLDFNRFNTLEEACVTLPATELAATGTVQSALAFHSEVNVDSLLWAAPNIEDLAWSKMLELIAANTTVPLKPEVKSATYFRFSNVSETKKGTITPTELETTDGKGPIYGARLKEGKEYQIKLSHRSLAESHEGTAPILPIKLELPTTHLQLSEPALEVLGWYQTTPIVFRALHADRAHQILLIRSDKKTEKSTTSQVVIRIAVNDSDAVSDHEAPSQDLESALFLPVPLSVGIGLLYRLRTQWALRIGLALVLTIQAMVAYLKDSLEKVVEGKATLSDLNISWPIVLILFFLGAVASILITYLSGQGKAKD